MGCEVSETSFKNKKYFSPAYSVISTSEASSNLSRFDGIRYGYLAEDYDDLNDLYKKLGLLVLEKKFKEELLWGCIIWDQVLIERSMKKR